MKHTDPRDTRLVQFAQAALDLVTALQPPAFGHDNERHAAGVRQIESLVQPLRRARRPSPKPPLPGTREVSQLTELSGRGFARRREEIANRLQGYIDALHTAPREAPEAVREAIRTIAPGSAALIQDADEAWRAFHAGSYKAAVIMAGATLEGVLQAAGSIDAGAAVRFEKELGERGEYVRTVSLDSPGGSLDDAMLMAQLIRDRNLSVEVRDGALCASSCPLVLAGGKSRSVAEKAAIGVHQFYAVTSRELGPEQAMADAQLTTARITRHLIEMGVDPALWLHALDTPPRRLYYLSAKELADYRLVTEARTAALVD